VLRYLIGVLAVVEAMVSEILKIGVDLVLRASLYSDID
jgi:hypothetical protein